MLSRETRFEWLQNWSAEDLSIVRRLQDIDQRLPTPLQGLNRGNLADRPQLEARTRTREATSDQYGRRRATSHTGPRNRRSRRARSRPSSSSRPRRLPRSAPRASQPSTTTRQGRQRLRTRPLPPPCFSRAERPAPRRLRPCSTRRRTKNQVVERRSPGRRKPSHRSSEAPSPRTPPTAA